MRVGLLKRATLLPLAFCGLAIAQQGGEKSNLGIFAETRLMRIAGMKPITMPKMPLGIKLPANLRRNLPGTASRGLTVKLWAPTNAPDNATASLSIPGGLQLGDKLDLEIFRPTPPTPAPTGTAPTQPTTSTGQMPDFTIKIYWGSSDTVRDGQPKIFSMANLTAEARSMMMNRMATARRSSSSLIYKDFGTTAYWPGGTDAPEIKPESSLIGSYTLNSSFAGNASITAPDGVDFLAPIEITSPSLDSKVPLDGSLPFQWNAIPNCLGQFASAFGMQDKNTLVLWTSSEVDGEKSSGDMGYLQMEDVRKMVDQKTFMSGGNTSVTIPAGIFKDCSFAMFNIIGYGPGVANSDAQPIARIQTKTDLTVMLTGAGGGRGRPNSER